MGKQKAKKTQKIVVRRLQDMMVHANAYVPKGANGRPFAVVKELKMKFDIQGLEAVRAKLGEVIQVLKSGTPDIKAEAALSDEMQLIMGNTAKAAGFKIDVDRPIAPLNVAKNINSLVEGLRALAPDIQARDLTLGDQASALLEQAEAVMTLVSKELTIEPTTGAVAPATESDAAVNADSENTPAETPSAKATEAAAAAAAVTPTPAPAPAVAEAGAAPAEEPIVTPAETPAPTTAEAASAAAATEAAEDDTAPVTKGELKTMFADFLTQVGAQTQAQVAQVVKAAPSYTIAPPATVPTEGVPEGGQTVSSGATTDDLFCMDLARKVQGDKPLYSSRR